MCNTTFIHMSYILAFLALLTPMAAFGQAADMVVVNARIYTGNAAQPLASALAVKDSRLIAVGKDVTSHIAPPTVQIDAKGATVIPGMIDSHVHMSGFGAILESFDLRHVKSIAEDAGILT